MTAFPFDKTMRIFIILIRKTPATTAINEVFNMVIVNRLRIINMNTIPVV